MLPVEHFLNFKIKKDFFPLLYIDKPSYRCNFIMCQQSQLVLTGLSQAKPFASLQDKRFPFS